MSAAGDPPAAGEQTQARIITALRRGSATVDELAALLGLTKTAIRVQLTRLERDGWVSRKGVRAGRTKPAQVYELAPEADLRLSRLYIPLVTQLLHTLAHRVSPDQFDALMRDAGRGLLQGRPRPSGSLRERVTAASELLNDFGGLAMIEEHRNGFLIRSHGCPLAATSARHPEACNAVESLLSEFIGAHVEKCCDRDERLRCCFEVSAEGHGPAAAVLA